MRRSVRIHGLQTGTVRVKPSQRVGRGRGSIRQLNILLDRSWTDSLPIYAWAIETVDGMIIVDTGETARTREPGYFPRWHPYFRLAVRLDVTPEQEVGPQLLKIGIRPDDVRTVILTHLHTDHAGGLHHFPKSEILVCDEELRLAKGFGGRLRGYLPNRWPEWFAPRSIVFEPNLFKPDPILDDMGFALDSAKWPQVFVMMGEFDYRHEVTVDVLGRIFERSISDIEEIKAKSLDQHAATLADRRRKPGSARSRRSSTRPITSSTIWSRPRSIRFGSRPAPTWPRSTALT